MPRNRMLTDPLTNDAAPRCAEASDVCAKHFCPPQELFRRYDWRPWQDGAANPRVRLAVARGQGKGTTLPPRLNFAMHDRARNGHRQGSFATRDEMRPPVAPGPGGVDARAHREATPARRPRAPRERRKSASG